MQRDDAPGVRSKSGGPATRSIRVSQRGFYTLVTFWLCFAAFVVLLTLLRLAGPPLERLEGPGRLLAHLLPLLWLLTLAAAGWLLLGFRRAYPRTIEVMEDRVAFHMRDGSVRAFNALDVTAIRKDGFGNYHLDTDDKRRAWSFPAAFFRPADRDWILRYLCLLCEFRAQQGRPIVAEGLPRGISPPVSRAGLVDWARRRRRRLVQVMVARGALGVSFLVTLFMATRGSELLSRTLSGVAALLFLGFFSVGRHVLPLRMGPVPVLLWIRGFHLQDVGAKVARLIEDACTYLAYPVTIRDTVVTHSRGFGLSRMDSAPVWLQLSAGAGAAAVLLVATLLVWSALALPVPRLGWLGFGLVALGVLAVSRTFSVAVLARVLGSRQFDGRAGLEKLRRGLADIEAQAESGLVGDMNVYQVGDDVWRDAVKMALKYADAVLIEASKLSKYVKWEIRQAAAELPPEALIFLSYKGNPEEQTPDAELRREIVDIVGKEAAARAQFFIYPQNDAPTPEHHAYLERSILRALADY